MTSIERALLDTSVFIARESGRPIDEQSLPAEGFVSIVTVAELHVGVLAAASTPIRSQRLATLEAVSSVETLPITADAARHWAELRVRLAEEGRRANINDLWIAAVAQSNDLPVLTQDGDFEVIEKVGGPRVIRV